MIEEPGSDLAHAAYHGADTSVTSAITYLEATAALARLEKGKRISSRELRKALAELDLYWAEIGIHSVADEMIQAASRAALNHRLRAYDSLHLATVRSFATEGGVTFACWDRELRDAVREHGFALVPTQI